MKLFKISLFVFILLKSPLFLSEVEGVKIAKLLKTSKLKGPEADISLVVIDLKYNKKQGPKICEMQPGSFSRFSGTEALARQARPEGNEEDFHVTCQKYIDFLSAFGAEICFCDPIYENMKTTLLKGGALPILSPMFSLAHLKEKTIKASNHLKDYKYFLYSTHFEWIFKGIPTFFPSVLFLDRAILPYSFSKYIMSKVFDDDEKTRKLRPFWKLYKKSGASSLAEQICMDFPGHRVVIKPCESTMGRGVLILEKQDLAKTFDFIFNTPKEILIEHEDRSYSHYARDKSSHFLVEEFIESDPLFFGEERLPYDCTMRVIAILCYDTGDTSLKFIDSYWYSPKMPLGMGSSLNESHKAKRNFFSPVDPDTLEAIEKELSPALISIYKKMIARDDFGLSIIKKE